MRLINTETKAEVIEGSRIKDFRGADWNFKDFYSGRLPDSYKILVVNDDSDRPREFYLKVFPDLEVVED